MICFAWDGFPQYAARCIGAFVSSTKERVVVVATRPVVPIEGMERVCGCQVFWVSDDEARTLRDLLGDIPRAIVVSGWGISVFNAYRDEVRNAGGKAIAMIDHNFRLGLKELVKAVRFRFLLRNKFDGFFVPGKSGRRLLRFYGVGEERIATGMYSADNSLFSQGKPLREREKRIIYVGQFIERKNVRRMIRAFQTVTSSRNDGWALHLYGSGPLKDELVRMSGGSVHVHPFAQPEQLAGLYHEARAFCLPSLEEHWGLVVHEAALSGCVLLLSDKVGAVEDLLGTHNGFSFEPKSETGMIQTFVKVMAMNEDALVVAQQESLDLAKTISIDKFVDGINALLKVR